MRSLSIGSTGMLAQQLNVEVISHNIANLNTTAYTRRRVEFQDLPYQNLRRVGSTSSDTGTIVPAGVPVGLGVKTAAVYRIAEQGNLVLTDHTLDLAINGDAYFPVAMQNGEPAYTPAAAFPRSENGPIVTAACITVLPRIARRPHPDPTHHHPTAQ